MRWIAALAILAGVLTIVIPGPFGSWAEPKLALAGPMVRLHLNAGHCSGGHIGGGLILTAEHCTRNGVQAIKTDKAEGAPATTLWASSKYDVALVQAAHEPKAESLNVSCRMVQIGEPIQVLGNPMIFEWIKTKGEVVGYHNGGIPVGFGELAWPEAVVLDVSVAPGNSGGPVLDKRGNLVGILVGGAMTGHAIMIGGPTICRLLGRAVGHLCIPPAS